MAVVNSFVLFRLIHGSNFILKKDFSRAFATTYLKLGHGSRVMRRRQLSFPSTSRTQVAHDLCLDQQNYMHGERGVANTKIARANFSLIALREK